MEHGALEAYEDNQLAVAIPDLNEWLAGGYVAAASNSPEDGIRPFTAPGS